MTWERFQNVLPDTATINHGGRLEIGGCDTGDLARQFGTPLFVCDEATFRGRLSRYREAFGAENVAYAAKAFLTKSIVPLLLDEGVAIDCASGGELYTALRGGMPAELVVLHGNNKSRDELEQAVDSRVGRVVVDSLDEIERLEAVAASREVAVAVIVRVTPGIEAHTHEYLQTGIEDTKFGLPIGNAALEAVKLAAAAPHLEVLGLHSHIGSQVFDLEPFASAAQKMTAFLADVRKQTRLELPELDLGGGLGIAYLPDDSPPAIEDHGKVVLDAVSSEAARLGTPVPAIRVEPGRSVAGPAMVTLYTAGVVKEIPGVRTYVSVDGGMSDNIRPMLYQAGYTFLSASRPGAAHDGRYAVSGKLCENGDVLTKDAMLPDVEHGELIAVAATGAYGYAMASNYNRQPRPAVILVRDGSASILARRETFEDLVRLEQEADTE